MYPYLITGATLGLAAGLSPGPLMAFLIAQTVRYGLREGIKTALAPILTDAPIVAAALLALSRLTSSGAILGAISVFGGLYVMWLGVDSLRVRTAPAAGSHSAPHSVRQAVTINLLNPHVYLFWSAAGAPTVLRASEVNAAAAIGFVSCFYLLLCGSKAALAFLIHRSRGFLGGAAYLYTLRALGAALIGFGMWLVWEGTAFFRAVQ